MKKIIIFTLAVFFAQNIFAQITQKIEHHSKEEVRFQSNGKRYVVFLKEVREFNYFAQRDLPVTKVFFGRTYVNGDYVNFEEPLIHAAEALDFSYNMQDSTPKVQSIYIRGNKLLIETNSYGDDSLIIFQWQEDRFSQMNIVKQPQPIICFPNYNN